MSSLAQQLQGIASIDASRLTSRTGAPSSKSYLFTPAEAAEQDFDAVWTIAQEGFEQLCALDPDMLEFEEELFAERTKRVDRMVLNKAENKALDAVLQRCMWRLGRWIGVMAGGKCIEWLVRRFRVHELNVENLIQVFLPYHESPNFPRILAIVTIPPTSVYSAPFAPLARTAQTVPRSYIVTAISPAKEKSLRLMSDVVRSLQLALEQGVAHRALLAFWSATIIELLEAARAARGPTEGTVKLLVEAFIEVLSRKHTGADVNAAVYPPLILLARTVRLADEPFLALLSALITPGTGAVPTQRILTLLVLLNDRKGWSLGLGDSGAIHLSQIKLLGETIEAAMSKYSFESAVRVVVEVMLERTDINAKSLRPLIESRALPGSVAKTLATGLITSTTRPSADALLTLLRERHPAVVDAAVIEHGADNVDVNLMKQVSASQAFADVYSADTSARLEGVRRMYEALRGSNQADRASAKAALLARLMDEDVSVLQAVYASADALVENVALREVVSAQRPAFVGSTSQAAIGAHLSFLATHGASEARLVFEQLFFPRLLCTEKRPSIDLRTISGPLAADVLIKSISSATGSLPGQAGGVEHNQAVVKALADAAKMDETLSAFFIAQLSSANRNSQLLAHLFVAELVANLKGAAQISLALSFVAAVEPHLSNMHLEPAGSDYPSKIYTSVHDEPDAAITLSQVRAMLIQSLVRVSKPASSIDWLAESSDATSYKTLAGKIYALANSPLLPDGLARDLLRSLFTQLGNDALIFFASVWTSTNAPAPLRVAALKHAAAFVRAHVQGEQSKVDFQVIIPTILVALRNQGKAVREAAVQLLRVVAKIPTEVTEIHGLETIYGSRSEHVQLLKPAFLERYLTALTDAGDDLVLDPSRIVAIHTSALGHTPSQNKKETGIKRAITASLVSHVVAWESLDARVTLLETLEGVQDSALLKGVLPLWSGLLDDESGESAWLAHQSAPAQTAFLAKLGETLNKGTGHALVNVEGESWRFFLGLFSAGPASKFGPRIRQMATERIAHGVFDSLSAAQQVPYASALLQSLHDLPTDEALATTAVFQRLSLSPEVIIQLIADLSRSLEATTSRKRQRQEDGAGGDRADLAVLDLTVLLESREWARMPGHAGLVASLLGLLSTVLAKKAVISEGVDYLEQEVLGAILAVLEKIDDVEAVQKAHVGIEPIIKTIRTTSNPRTSQRALLVAAELARLTPDAVLHNVMPIFTFMGSADLQRDDAYTFGVVERTVKRIVPVLVANLRETTAESGLELWNASAAFVGIFTDMAGRLPKHRTLPFYVHLVQSLGQGYLAPVSMLLIDRAAAKGSKGAAQSATAQAVELALSVSAASTRGARLQALQETVQEVARLVADLPNAEKSAFLSQFLDENDDSSRTLRQITLVMHFASGLATSLVGKPADQAVVQAVVHDLVGMLAIGRTPAMQTSDVPAALQRCFGEVIKLLGADNFLGVVGEVLNSQDAANIVIALDLFTERLGLVKKDVRTKHAPAIGAIVRKSAELLVAPTTVPALAAVRAVATSALPGEDSALATVAVKLVANLALQTETAIINDELALLDILTRHLGPRIIPAIQPMLAALLAYIDKATTAPSTAKAAFSTLSALLDTVAGFISAAQLANLLKSSIQARGRVEESSSALLSVAAKKIGTKMLFPVVMGLWKDVQKMDESCMEAYFYLLRLTLKAADRAMLPGLIKTVFTFFLDVFDLRHKLHASDAAHKFDADVITRIESSAIGSFLELVTKLSESTFKPLFTRLYDWAVIDLGDGVGKGKDKEQEQRVNERKTVLLHVMMGLLTKFRSLLSPYIGTLLPHIEELLPAFASGDNVDPDLWTLLIRVLGKSFEADDGAFWTETLHLKLVPLLTAQIPVFPRSPHNDVLASTCASLAGSTTSEPVLKLLNHRICLLTREEDVRVRLAALRVMQAVWERQAEEMVGLVPETVSEYLAELLEDENADVETAARGVLARIEKVTGSLEEHLE